MQELQRGRTAHNAEDEQRDGKKDFFFLFLNILKFSTQGHSLHAKDAANKFMKKIKESVYAAAACVKKNLKHFGAIKQRERVKKGKPHL